MNSKLFIGTAKYLFTDWLNSLNQYIYDGKINMSGEYSFANILRIAESPTHFICELYGSKQYKPGQPITVEVPNTIEKVKNTTSFFCSNASDVNQQKAVIKITGDGNTLEGLLISTRGDLDLIQRKIKLPVIPVNINYHEAEIPIMIGPEVVSLLFNDLELLESDGIRIIYRIIHCAIIINKKESKETLITFFQDTIKRQLKSLNLTRRLIGLNTIFNSPIEHFAAQLFSLSNQNVKESVIDKFIQQHSNEFAQAMGYKRALSQKKLKWLERELDDPDESKPDFLLERYDGYYDILDLKTGAIKFKSITKYKKSGKAGKIRVRFVDYVSELIAQLKDYERYFNLEKNKEYAYQKHEVKIQSPKLIGIVGNYNNFEKEEVKDALNQYKDNIIVFSYYDVVNMLRKIN